MSDDFDDLLRELDEEQQSIVETKHKIKEYLLKEQPSIIHSRQGYKHNTVNVPVYEQQGNMMKNSNIIGDLLKDLDMDGYSILNDKNNNSILQNNKNKLNISQYLKDLNITKEHINENENYHPNYKNSIQYSTRDILFELEKSKFGEVNNTANLNKVHYFKQQSLNDSNIEPLYDDIDIDNLIKEMNEEQDKKHILQHKTQLEQKLGHDISLIYSNDKPSNQIQKQQKYYQNQQNPNHNHYQSTENDLQELIGDNE